MACSGAWLEPRRRRLALHDLPSPAGKRFRHPVPAARSGNQGRPPDRVGGLNDLGDGRGFVAMIALEFLRLMTTLPLSNSETK